MEPGLSKCLNERGPRHQVVVRTSVEQLLDSVDESTDGIQSHQRVIHIHIESQQPGLDRTSVNLLAFSHPPNPSQRLENIRQCELIRFEADQKHFSQEFHGHGLGRNASPAIGVRSNAADDGVAETEAELRIVRVVENDGADVEEVAGGGRSGREGNEFGIEELLLERGRSCFNGDGMDLFQLSYGFAGIEVVRKKMEFLGIHTLWLI